MLLFCLSVLVCKQLSAATLVTYNFGTNLSPNSVDSQVTANTFNGTGTARSVNSYAYQFTQTANSGYMQFTLTANSGQFLDLNTIDFSYDFIQTAGTLANVTGTIALYYSADAFATAGTLIQSYNETSGAVISSGASTFTDVNPPVSLSGIANTNSLTFRFVLTNNGGLNTINYRYGIDSVVIDGTVSAIPEPSAWGLILFVLGLGAVFLRTRRALSV